MSNDTIPPDDETGVQTQPDAQTPEALGEVRPEDHRPTPAPRAHREPTIPGPVPGPPPVPSPPHAPRRPIPAHSPSYVPPSPGPPGAAPRPGTGATTMSRVASPSWTDASTSRVLQQRADATGSTAVPAAPPPLPRAPGSTGVPPSGASPRLPPAPHPPGTPQRASGIPPRAVTSPGLRSPLPSSPPTRPSGVPPRPSDVPPARGGTGPHAIPPTDTRERVARVVAQLQAERDRITKNSNELGGLRSRLSLLDQRVSELEEEVRERPASAGASGEPERVKALEKRVQGLEDVAKKVRAGDTALREILDRQQKSVAHGGSALSEVAAGVDGLRESQERLFESLSSQETQLHELKKALDGRTEELGRVTKTLDLAMDEIARLRDVIETERTRGDTRQVVAPEGRPTEPFVSDPSPPPGPPQAAAPEPTSRDFAGDDDLEAIKGIGPKFEKALKDLGISTYAQIASWTEADVTEVAEKIGARPQRIHKDDWIAAAKKLTTRG